MPKNGITVHPEYEHNGKWADIVILIYKDRIQSGAVLHQGQKRQQYKGFFVWLFAIYIRLFYIFHWNKCNNITNTHKKMTQNGMK